MAISSTPGAAPGRVAAPREAAAESLLALKRRARRINRALAEKYPYAHAELDFRNPFELVVATVLSAQTTDVLVNQVTKILFAKPSPRSWKRSCSPPAFSGPKRKMYWR